MWLKSVQKNDFQKNSNSVQVQQSSAMKSAEKNKNGGSLLNKSHSDGELLEDVNAGDNVVKSKPKAVKFVQPPTLPSYQQSEDDVSDRDLPELAPIEDYERIKGEVFSKVKIYFVISTTFEFSRQKVDTNIIEKGML